MLSRRPDFMYTIKQPSKNTHPYGPAGNETRGGRRGRASCWPLLSSVLVDSDVILFVSLKILNIFFIKMHKSFSLFSNLYCTCVCITVGRGCDMVCTWEVGGQLHELDPPLPPLCGFRGVFKLMGKFSPCWVPLAGPSDCIHVPSLTSF